MKSLEQPNLEKEPDNLEFSENMSQQDFIQLARQQAKKIFPEQDLTEFRTTSKYYYFPVLEYIERKNIIDVELIAKLKSGGRLLSVGVGDAMTEKFLAQAVALPKKAITMSDIEFDPQAQEVDLPKIKFDLTKKWPIFKNKFDYILFLESFGVAGFPDKEKGNIIHRFFDEVEEISKKVLAKKNDHLRSNNLDFYTHLAEMDIPTVRQKYQSIYQAIKNLKLGGELRFSGDLLSNHELAYILIKLQDDFPGQIDFAQNPYLKIIKTDSSKSKK